VHVAGPLADQGDDCAIDAVDFGSNFVNGGAFGWTFHS
jgi:hypothetical protein